MMSPWLFNVYVDCVVRQVNARVLRWKVRDGGILEINRLLFADDTALVFD